MRGCRRFRGDRRGSHRSPPGEVTDQDLPAQRKGPRACGTAGPGGEREAGLAGGTGVVELALQGGVGPLEAGAAGDDEKRVGYQPHHLLDHVFQVSAGAIVGVLERLRHGLRQIQYRSRLVDRCLTGTGLTLTTSRLQPQYWASRCRRAAVPHGRRPSSWCADLLLARLYLEVAAIGARRVGLVPFQPWCGLRGRAKPLVSRTPRPRRWRSTGASPTGSRRSCR